MPNIPANRPYTVSGLGPLGTGDRRGHSGTHPDGLKTTGIVERPLEGTGAFQYMNGIAALREKHPENGRAESLHSFNHLRRRIGVGLNLHLNLVTQGANIRWGQRPARIHEYNVCLFAPYRGMA